MKGIPCKTAKGGKGGNRGKEGSNQLAGKEGFEGT